MKRSFVCAAWIGMTLAGNADLPLGAQAKMLRALQHGEIQKLGPTARCGST